MFFTGIAILLVAFTIMYFASVMFDVSYNSSVNAVIFQPDNLSKNRIKQPVSASKLSDNIEEKLIKKYVTEYFYVIPDAENVALRSRNDSILAALSAPTVFRNWQKTVVPKIQEMAGDKILRDVKITNEIVKQGDYWQVHYELKKWDKPNIINAQPIISSGIIYLKTDFEPGLRETRGGKNFDMNKYIKSGGDPAALFKFRVTEVKE